MATRALWPLPALITVVLFVSGPLLAHVGLARPLIGFLTWAGSAVPALAAVVVGIWLYATGSRIPGLVSILVGVLPIALIVYGLLQGRDLPRINDVATNLDNPPTLVAAGSAPENEGKDLTFPDAFREPVQRAYPDLISLQLAMPAPEAFALARTVATGIPDWRITRVDEAALTFEGSDTSGLFQFTDDFVVRVLPMDGNAQIDMRSRSRVGQGDFGANAKRIRRFFAAVEAEAATGQ